MTQKETHAYFSMLIQINGECQSKQSSGWTRIPQLKNEQNWMRVTYRAIYSADLFMLPLFRFHYDSWLK